MYRIKPLTVLLLVFLLLGSCTYQAYALTPLDLTDQNFFDGTGANGGNAGWDTGTTIAGQAFQNKVWFTLPSQSSTAKISLNVSILKGYSAITFWLGLRDSNTADGMVGHLDVYGDGHRYETYTAVQGRPAYRVIVPFRRYAILTFGARNDGNGNTEVNMAEPQAALVHSSVTPPAQTLSVAPTVPAGGTEVVNLKTKPGAYVTLVVTFPQGRPLVVGPVIVSATGQWSNAFPVPEGDSGQASVVVIANGHVLQGVFTIQ